MDSKICTFINTTELDAEIQKILQISTHTDDLGSRVYARIISVIRTSEFHRLNGYQGECADYIILYTSK